MHGVVKPHQIGLHVVLEEHAEPHASRVGRLDERIGALDGDVDRLFDQHVQAAPARGDALRGVQARWAADGHQVHRLDAQGTPSRSA